MSCSKANNFHLCSTCSITKKMLASTSWYGLTYHGPDPSGGLGASVDDEFGWGLELAAVRPWLVLRQRLEPVFINAVPTRLPDGGPTDAVWKKCKASSYCSGMSTSDWKRHKRDECRAVKSLLVVGLYFHFFAVFS
jgi:hypothetical protein